MRGGACGVRCVWSAVRVECGACGVRCVCARAHSSTGCYDLPTCTTTTHTHHPTPNLSQVLGLGLLTSMVQKRTIKKILDLNAAKSHHVGYTRRCVRSACPQNRSEFTVASRLGVCVRGIHLLASIPTRQLHVNSAHHCSDAGLKYIWYHRTRNQFLFNCCLFACVPNAVRAYRPVSIA